jgi:FkbH-like protein
MNAPRNLLEPVLQRELRGLEPAAKLARIVDCLLEAGDGFNAALADLMSGELLRFAPDLRREALRRLAGAPQTATTAYLRAHLSTADGDAISASAAWDGFFQLAPHNSPALLLAYARSLHDSGRSEDAARQLRKALAQYPAYPFFPRAERLIAAVDSAAGAHLRSCRVAILSTTTTALLAQVFRANCFRDRIGVSLYEGLFGAQQQEILDPESGLARFRPGVVFLISNWRDLHLPPAVADEASFIESFVTNQKSLWAKLTSQFGSHVVQFGIDYPASESYGYLAASLPGGRSRVIDQVNLRMRAEAGSQVSILDAAGIQRETGSGQWQDEVQWHLYRVHPAPTALPALAESMTAHLRAVLGLTRKVLVTDLDNTLWQGVIGEDGLQGIGIGPGSPIGEAHYQLQQYLLDLKARGVLLAVCSKNNPDDARLPFERHPKMALKLDDFACFKANWQDKAQNLREIAAELRLGTDSLVFLDDSPVEREWVRSQMPEVAVVDLGASVFHYVRDLDRGHYFFTLSLSAEDQARASQYQEEAAREQLRATAASLDEFLAGLQLRASVAPISAANIARVTQLVNKTNQFNVTTRRYTEPQVQQIAADPCGWARAFHLADRMGDYGLIGVIFCRPAGDKEWDIDTWLMSCRALGRQMEKFMFERLLTAAVDREIRVITGVYRPTAKNGLVANLYPDLGFEQFSADAGETRYRFRVPEQVTTLAPHVRLVTAADEVRIPA